METISQLTGQPYPTGSVERRTELFNLYVKPHLNMVYKLCIKYTYVSSDIDDNYNEVLINFFKYIESYDPERSIQTWLHIVTKRFVSDMNLKRSNFKRTEDIDTSEIADQLPDDGKQGANLMNMSNYHRMYGDDVLNALNKLQPIYREALMLQQAGYKLHEIMEITYLSGSLKMKNLETVKSRLFLAKKKMRELITRDGESREK